MGREPDRVRARGDLSPGAAGAQRTGLVRSHRPDPARTLREKVRRQGQRQGLRGHRHRAGADRAEPARRLGRVRRRQRRRAARGRGRPLGAVARGRVSLGRHLPGTAPGASCTSRTARCTPCPRSSATTPWPTTRPRSIRPTCARHTGALGSEVQGQDRGLRLLHSAHGHGRDRPRHEAVRHQRGDPAADPREAVRDQGQRGTGG